jgi:outer membrane protein insertion porin family
MALEITKEAEYQPSLTEKDKERQIKEGERFQDKRVKAFEVYIQKKYSDRGYPFSTVKDQVTLLHDKKKADINFQIDPGPKSYFGATWIRSDSLVPKSFIRNQLRYSQGELFSKELVSKLQRNPFCNCR